MSVGASSVSKWLVAEHGFTPDQIKSTSISNHFQRGHHLRGDE